MKSERLTYLLLGLIGVVVLVALLAGQGVFRPAQKVDTTTTASGLQYQDLTVGNGAEARPGMTAEVHYVGTLLNGAKFDASYDRNETLKFVIGAGEVIAGWDEGVIGMKTGGKRKLVVPPQLGYGSRDLGIIPPNSTLVFEVELISVN